MSDIEMINSPKHYNDESGVECCEVTDYMQFNGGNCFKYLYRCGSKFDDIEDLKKAAWYADRSWRLQEETNHGKALSNIRIIAKHRSGNIADAMRFIYEDHWAMVERRIEDEIARLDSEANDD